MKQYMYKSFRLKPHSFSILFLATGWILSVLFGCLLSFSMSENGRTLITRAMDLRISILGYISILLTPPFVVWLSFRISRYWPVCFLLLVKGLCLGFTIYVTVFAYDNAGWLVHFLISFSNIITLIPLWFVVFRLMSSDNKSSKSILVLFVYNGIVGLIDYFIVSPSVLAL